MGRGVRLKGARTAVPFPGFPTAQFLQSMKRFALLYVPARPSVPQFMPAKILNSGTLESPVASRYSPLASRTRSSEDSDSELTCDMVVLRSCSGGIARDRRSTPQRKQSGGHRRPPGLKHTWCSHPLTARTAWYGEERASRPTTARCIGAGQRVSSNNVFVTYEIHGGEHRFTFNIRRSRVRSKPVKSCESWAARAR